MLCFVRNCKVYYRALCEPSSPALPFSQQALAGQLDLARRFAGLEAAPGNTNTLSVCELEFVLVAWPCAGAVVREMYAGEGVGAEVIGTVCCGRRILAGVKTMRSSRWQGYRDGHTSVHLGPVVGGIRGGVLLLVLVLLAAAAAAEHLLEYIELRAGKAEKDQEEGEKAKGAHLVWNEVGEVFGQHADGWTRDDNRVGCTWSIYYDMVESCPVLPTPVIVIDVAY